MNMETQDTTSGAGAWRRSAIQPVTRDGGELPLSFAQQRLWFLEQRHPGSSAYILPFAVQIVGRLDVGALRRSVSEIVRRHEVLRTVFPMVDDEPKQVINQPSDCPLPLVDLSGLADEARLPAARRLSSAESRRPFDLARGPLLRPLLLRLAADRHVLQLTLHHVVADGWSLSLLSRELVSLYEAALLSLPSPLPPLPIQYADYAAWQRARLSAGKLLEAELSYWRGQLAGAPQSLSLPADGGRGAGSQAKASLDASLGASVKLRLSPELTRRLKELGRAEGATLYMVLLAGFWLLLMRYGGVRDVVVGAPVAGRGRAELEGLVGLFVNTLALRGRVEGGETFREVVRAARAVCLGAYAHQEVPFERVVEELHPERGASRTPLVQAMLALQNVPGGAARSAGLRFEPVEVEGEGAKFDLLVSLHEEGGGLRGRLEYRVGVLTAEGAERMAGHYEALLEAGAGLPDVAALRLEMMDEGERRQVLEGWNATRRAYGGAGECLHEAVGRRAAESRDEVAVVSGDERVSYGELEQRAGLLAGYLAEAGVGAEVAVGLLLERSAEMVVGVLGVLKAGGCYVPLEAGLPGGRLRYMMEEAGVSLLLTQQSLASRLPSTQAKVVYLDAEWETIARSKRTKPIRKATAENTAYIIFTSGSTGRPKGIMIPHRAIMNHMLWMNETFPLTAGDRVLQKTSFSFDASIWEFFAPLMAGAQLVMARLGGEKDSSYLVKTIDEQGITVLQVVPSMLQMLLDTPGLERCRSLRRVFCGGEALTIQLQERFFARMSAELHNLYGPAEAAVDTVFWSCRPGTEYRTVPIGRPVSNTQVYILDEELQPVPVGVGGELYLGGLSLGRGYVNRPGLTAERFIPDPFGAEPGARLYRTGDVVRYLPAGEVEYLGRADRQVKVRGFRIELGEVEAALRGVEGVREAVVEAREGAGGQARLVGWVVCEDVAAEAAGGWRGRWRERLRERLPEYMVPSSLTEVEQWPLTPNGKTDRRALPEPEEGKSERGVKYVEPRTAVEEILAEVWSQVLDVERVGVHDNFFELGGHSLLAAQVMARLTKVFQTEIPLQSIFDAPTIAGLAEFITTATAGERQPEEHVLGRTTYDNTAPLSFAQQRLWFLAQLEPESAAYHISSAVGLYGTLDTAALGRALSELVRRHEVLRTSFPTIDGQPMQYIAPARGLVLPLIDVSRLKGEECEAEVRRLYADVGWRPFALAQEAPFRAVLLRLAADRHVLQLTLHHVVADGWSLSLLSRELVSLYEAALLSLPPPLPPLPIQYADYAAWQRQRLSAGKLLEAELSYWREQLAGAPQSLSLPSDGGRGAGQQGDASLGASVKLRLSPELTRRLKELGRAEGATLYMVLLAGFWLLLMRYAGVRDVVVGAPVAGRGRAELEGLVGLFVNTLALRGRVESGETFREVVRAARAVCLGAYAHQEVPFERVVEELHPERGASRTPLVQAMLALQNVPGGAARSAGLRFEPVEVEGEGAKFDLLVSLHEEGGGLRGRLEFRTGLLSREAAERMARHYEALLEAGAGLPDAAALRLEMMDEGERRQVLEGWNATRRSYESGECLHEAVRRRAAESRDEVAVVSGDERVSYGELEQRAGLLAGYLAEAGVGPEVAVGLLLERSAEMVVGMLGVLKAGGCYVPLEAGLPGGRLRYMMEEAGVSLLLTQQSLASVLPEPGVQTIMLDADWDEIVAKSIETSLPKVSPDNAAYVIFTSGSTGRPKGVVCSHRGVTNLLAHFNRIRPLRPGDQCSFWTSNSFDVSVYEIFSALSAGATLHIVPEHIRPDFQQFASWLEANGIQSAYLPPSMLGEFAQSLAAGAASSRLRRLLVGVEPIPQKVLSTIADAIPGVQIVNGYGPTEASICATLYADEPLGKGERNTPIGRPVDNTQVYLLDEYLEPVPVGVRGELYIGGVGLARGYVRRPGLTAERFIPDPFGAEPGARLYRTGDVARYLPAGEIEYLGRTDYQVKVRGFRVELGEVEAALRELNGVREAVVEAREGPGGQARLIAWVRRENGADVREAGAWRVGWRGRLRERLPEYMVPSSLTEVERWPLTPNGKIDRRALPEPEWGAETGQRSREVSGPVEEAVAEVWREVLGAERVGAEENFFELGGHSLLAARVAARLQEVFPVSLSLRGFFAAPTVAQQAEAITELLLKKVEELPDDVLEGESV
jgi:amino acid adenylation domain-containing protein